MMRVEDLLGEFASEFRVQANQKPWIESGGSAIIGPDSRYVVEPVFDREELLVADLHLNHIDQESMTLECVGALRSPRSLSI